MYLLFFIFLSTQCFASDSEEYRERLYKQSYASKSMRETLNVDSEKDVISFGDGWTSYKRAKTIQDPQKKLEKLLEIFSYGGINKECKGWVAHDIGDIFIEKYNNHRQATYYYKLAMTFGDRECQKQTEIDMVNHGLL